MKLKKSKDIITFYKVKPFGQQLLISFIDKSLTRFTEILNKKENKIYSKWLKDRVKTFNLDDDTNGMVIFEKDCFHPICLLLKNNPTIKSLRHEVYHLTDLLSKYYCFENEPEFKAYLFNDLYDDIINIYETRNK